MNVSHTVVCLCVCVCVCVVSYLYFIFQFTEILAIHLFLAHIFMQRIILCGLFASWWAWSAPNKQSVNLSSIMDKKLARVENSRRSDLLRNPNKPFTPVTPVGLHVRCVPVIALGLVADPMSFSTRLFHSIDHCVDNMVVMITRDFDFMHQHSALAANSNIRNLTVIRSPYRLFSVSEGWNTGLQAFPKSSWFLICNYDVEFLRGQLRDLSYLFWNDSSVHVGGRPAVEVGSVGYQNLGGSGFNVIAMTSSVLNRVGYFDENYFPAYYEDVDFEIRMMLDGTRSKVYRNITPWHGQYSRKKSYVSGINYIMRVSSSV